MKGDFEMKMNVSEVRETVAPMVIWMATAAIKEARKAITGGSPLCRYPKETPDYNKPEVETASAILFNTFEYCEFEIRQALIGMPKEYTGYSSAAGNYFNAFVETLGKGGGVLLRSPDWVLERM